MQSEPGEPGDRSAEPKADGQLAHGRPPPDGRHDAFVLVGEFSRSFSGHQLQDLFCGVATFLYRRLGKLRQVCVVLCSGCSYISSGEHLGVANQPQVSPDIKSPSYLAGIDCSRQVPLSDSGRPDHCPGRDDLAGGQVNLRRCEL